jgi:hypothetical protein
MINVLTIASLESIILDNIKLRVKTTILIQLLVEFWRNNNKINVFYFK